MHYCLTPVERRVALDGHLHFLRGRGISRDVAVQVVAAENNMSYGDVDRVASGMRWEVSSRGAS